MLLLFLYTKKVNNNRLDKKEFIVKKNSTLLVFLIEELGYSRNNAKKLLSNKATIINGKHINKFDYELKINDILTISKGPIKNDNGRDIEIIYEDDDLIAINKPAGLLSIGSEKDKVNTAYKMVMNYLKDKDKHNKIFVLHRIDKDTSGVLVFAKNIKTKDALQENWNEIVSNRSYYAIVLGKLKEKEGHIENYLKENSVGTVYQTDANNKYAKKAITEYRVIKETKEYSLLDVKILTGRKNQIRVTFASMGNPIVGDEKYGNKKSKLNRLGLHAYRLDFINPLNKKAYSFISNMPHKFKDI